MTGAEFCSFVRCLSIGDEAIVVLSFFNLSGARSAQTLRTLPPFGSPGQPFVHEILESIYTVGGTNRGEENSHQSPLIVNQRYTEILEAFFLHADSVLKPSSVGELTPDDFLVVLDGEIVMSSVFHENSLRVLARYSHLLPDARELAKLRLNG